MFDAIAHEAPVDDHETDNCVDGEELEESRELFWERESRAALLEPPSVAIIEGLMQRQFEDWVSDDCNNWLEHIAQLVNDLDLPVSDLKQSEPTAFKSLADFTLVDKQLLIPQKNTSEQREQLTLF
jgi:hypothetical protein